MIRMINKLSGASMWVADNRVNEYIGAGHRLASDAEKPAKKAEPEEKTLCDVAQDNEPVKKSAAKPKGKK